MPRMLPACLAHASRALPIIMVALTTVIPTAGRGAVEAAPPGRFLYAGDDDWDWASPLGAKEPCKLSRYGAMPWSALDWAEDGLKEVRGVLVGTPPAAKKTMTMQGLSDLRGEKATYRHQAQAPGVFRNLLEGEEPPNVLILMQNTGKGNSLDGEAIGTLKRFIKTGGRVVVLDDWKRYGALLEGVMADALTLPPGPPIGEPPPPRAAEPPKVEKPAGLPKPPPEPKVNPAAERFRELVPRLGAAEFRTREDADTAIRELGTDVLELIEEAETEDPEIAARLNKIREALKPKPKSKGMSSAAQDARRLAKHEASKTLVTEAARKLRKARIPHQLNDVFVDKEKRPLPALRIEFSR